MTKKSLALFMEKIGYTFKDISLLEIALSHRSYGQIHNERLEFLGDSIVNFIIAYELFHQFPNAPEGKLSRLRSHLVRGETLAEIAQEFQLGDFLKLGAGELRSGGRTRISTLANTVEAVIGAIYLDSDMATCHQCVKFWYQPRLDNLSLSTIYKDPKSLLQELLQAQQLPIPEYQLVSAVGAEHEQYFTVGCKISLLDELVLGEGHSRRKAEQDAAAKTLETLKNANHTSS